MNVTRTSRSRRSTLPGTSLAAVADVRATFTRVRAGLEQHVPDLAALDAVPVELLGILQLALARGATDVNIEERHNTQDMTRWSDEARTAAAFDRTFLVGFHIGVEHYHGRFVLTGKAPNHATVLPTGYGARTLHAFVSDERTSLQAGPLAIASIALGPPSVTVGLSGLSV